MFNLQMRRLLRQLTRFLHLPPLARPMRKAPVSAAPDFQGVYPERVEGDAGRPQVSVTRSAYAQKIFPEMSKKDAGCAVAGMIRSNNTLYRKLLSLGYTSGKVGYTVPQVELLDEYFSQFSTN